MKHYYAIFKKTNEAIEVEFPDLPDCLTFGKKELIPILINEKIMASYQRLKTFYFSTKSSGSLFATTRIQSIRFRLKHYPFPTAGNCTIIGLMRTLTLKIKRLNLVCIG